jgi:hypothetical protein
VTAVGELSLEAAMRRARTAIGRVFAIFLATIASATAVQAVPIVWEFSGKITGTSARPGGGVTIGTPFSGSVTFDSSWSIVDRDPLTSGAVYGGEGYPYGIELSVGAATYSTFSDGRPIWYTVADDHTLFPTGSVADSLVIGDQAPRTLSTRAVILTLQDQTATLLSSEEIVAVPPDLARLSSATVFVSGLPGHMPWSIGTMASGTIDHLSVRQGPGSAIPEPTAALLFAAGALAIAGRLGSGRPRR